MAVSHDALLILLFVACVGGSYYIGCFVDSPRRTLKTGVYVDPNLTTDDCIQRCILLGNSLAGTQYRKECFCGDDIDLSKLVADDECDMTCGGNQDEICGGNWRISVYNTGSLPTTTDNEITTSQTQTTNADEEPTTANTETTTRDIRTPAVTETTSTETKTTNANNKTTTANTETTSTETKTTNANNKTTTANTYTTTGDIRTTAVTETTRSETITTNANHKTTTANTETTSTGPKTTIANNNKTTDMQMTTDQTSISTTLSVGTGNDSCKCNCNKTNWNTSLKLNKTEQQELLSQLQTLLTVSKKSTSTFKRKLISVYDSRTSSITMGCFAGAILSVIAGIIVVPDIIRLVVDVQR